LTGATRSLPDSRPAYWGEPCSKVLMGRRKPVVHYDVNCLNSRALRRSFQIVDEGIPHLDTRMSRRRRQSRRGAVSKHPRALRQFSSQLHPQCPSERPMPSEFGLSQLRSSETSVHWLLMVVSLRRLVGSNLVLSLASGMAARLHAPPGIRPLLPAESPKDARCQGLARADRSDFAWTKPSSPFPAD
jgi:hypothetical protein